MFHFCFTFIYSLIPGSLGDLSSKLASTSWLSFVELRAWKVSCTVAPCLYPRQAALFFEVWSRSCSGSSGEADLRDSLDGQGCLSLILKLVRRLAPFYQQAPHWNFSNTAECPIQWFLCDGVAESSLGWWTLSERAEKSLAQLATLTIQSPSTTCTWHVKTQMFFNSHLNGGKSPFIYKRTIELIYCVAYRRTSVLFSSFTAEI